MKIGLKIKRFVSRIGGKRLAQFLTILGLVSIFAFARTLRNREELCSAGSEFLHQMPLSIGRRTAL